jgi:hypothetical protein
MVSAMGNAMAPRRSAEFYRQEAERCRLLRDAALMRNGAPDSATLPAEILAFINANKLSGTPES